MIKTYNISQDKFLEAKKLITQNGGTIFPNDSFEISGVKGNFIFENNNLTIKITDKPWLASWSMIEDKLNEFFN